MTPSEVATKSLIKTPTNREGVKAQNQFYTPLHRPSSHIMHCGVETLNERSPNRTGLRVNFSDKGEVKERREKFLTAKYGSHQMSLIRKRLAVEMWLYDELQKLFDPPVSVVFYRSISSSRCPR